MGARYTSQAVTIGRAVMMAIAAQLTKYRYRADPFRNIASTVHASKAITSPCHAKCSNAAVIA
jgi:hypothetical protein